VTNYDDVIDFVRIARDVETGAPVTILILDTADGVAQDLSPDLARSVARKLNALADEYEQYKPLRRLVAVENDLRGLND
jgi:hypothetical protein